MKRILLTCTLNLCILLSFAQDMNYTKRVVKDLSSNAFFGRGYVNRGDSLAALYLKKEFKSIRLKGLSPDYYQSYVTPMSTFPKDPVLVVGDKKLESASEFFVYPSSPSIKGEYPLVWLDKSVMTDGKALKSFLEKDLSSSFVVVDSAGLGNKELFFFASRLVKENVFHAKGIILRVEKLKYTARTFKSDLVKLVVKTNVLDTTMHKITVDIENRFILEYHTQNLMGYIPGKSDTCVIFTAHYDHLGMMGSKIYPGAIDNASGVSMVLNLARYFKKKHRRPKYTLVFMLFSGEEAGLLGSKYYVSHPLFPLEKTKIVVNFDMVGTGSRGVYLFNSKTVPDMLKRFEDINKKKNYVFKFHGTGEAACSDHASFHARDVKTVSFYSDGDNEDYHEITDVGEKVPYTQYEGIFKFVRDFTDQL